MKKGVTSIIVGAIEIFLFQFILGPLAIALGVGALKDDDKAGYGGIALGIFDLILFVVAIFWLKSVGIF